MVRILNTEQHGENNCSCLMPWIISSATTLLSWLKWFLTKREPTAIPIFLLVHSTHMFHLNTPSPMLLQRCMPLYLHVSGVKTVLRRTGRHCKSANCNFAVRNYSMFLWFIPYLKLKKYTLTANIIIQYLIFEIVHDSVYTNKLFFKLFLQMYE